jgi:hypothetical protein
MQNLEAHIDSAISSGFLNDNFRVLPKFLDQVDECTSKRQVWILKVNGIGLWEYLFDLPLWFDGLRHYAGFGISDLVVGWKDYVLPAPVVGPQNKCQFVHSYLARISEENDEV